MTTLDQGRPATREDQEDASVPAVPDVPVSAHRSSPDRTVFVEEGNTDGWIASNITVDLKR